MKNCPNCGAAITSRKCEYCGTVFDDKEVKVLVESKCLLSEEDKREIRRRVMMGEKVHFERIKKNG